MRAFPRFVLLAPLFVATACARHSTDASPEIAVNRVTNGSFSATLAGASWSAVGQVTVAKLGADNLNITAVSDSYGIAFKLGGVTGTGVYPLTAIPTMGSGASVTTASGLRWATGGLGLTGSISITTLTASRVAGSFAFEAVPITGTSSVLRVQNGTFDVSY